MGAGAKAAAEPAMAARAAIFIMVAEIIFFDTAILRLCVSW